MKKYLPILIFLLVSTSVIAQSDWNVVWKLDTLPFIPFANDSTKTGSEISVIKAGFDTDQDGWGEFLCAWTDLDSNYTLMYEATGDNTYELVWYWLHPVPANTYAGIAVGDIDNNDKVDIVISLASVTDADNPNPPRLWVFEWSGVVGENKYGNYSSGEMVPTNDWDYGLPAERDFRPYSQTIEDIDNDGQNELITGVRQSGEGSNKTRDVFVSSVQGELAGFGSWDVEFIFAQELGGANFSTTTGDLDGDGNSEIHMFVWNFFTMRIFECMGDLQYETAFEVDELYSGGIDHGGLDAVGVADANGDGVNEMYLAGMESVNQLFIITGVSDLSQMTSDNIHKLLTIPPVGSAYGVGKLRSMYIADPDKDGNMSMMIAGERNGRIYDVEYKGEGDPADSTSWDINVIFDIWEESGFPMDSSVYLSPRLFYGHPGGDMDNDGKDEYIFVNYSADFSIWDGDSYVWMIEIDEATGVNNDAGLLPNSIELSQNYPNPFNPSTNIEFSLNKLSNVKLVVYDVLGRELETLVNRSMPSGIHSFKFDASNYSSGIYYYSLFVGNGSSDLIQTRKMLLLK